MPVIIEDSVGTRLAYYNGTGTSPQGGFTRSHTATGSHGATTPQIPHGETWAFNQRVESQE